MKQFLILAALAFSIAACNNQDGTDTSTGNADSAGATGTNPGMGTLDTTRSGIDTMGSTTGGDSLK